MTGSDESVVVERDAWVGDARTAAMLEAVIERVQPHLAQIIDDFYDRLSLRPAIVSVLGRLTGPEFSRLKDRQARHLLALLSPAVSPRELRDRSREVGRVHAMVGVEMDWYVDAVAEHRRGVIEALDRWAPDLDLVTAQTLVTERFMSDLHGALLGYRDFDNAQNRVMLQITEAASRSRTVADLARDVVESLSVLDGMAVCFFARPDAQGNILYEIGAGDGFEEFAADVAAHGQPHVTTGSETAAGQGPLGRAWRTGEIQRCDSYQTDPTTEIWRPIAARFRWRSSAAVPLTDRRGATRALLSLHALWPGYFAADSSVAMLEQIKQAFERALTDLEEQPSLTSGVSGYTDRLTHLALLAAGEVEMLFQPVVSLPSGRLTKLEALARLRAGDRLVTPAEFLPAFGDDELYRLFEVGIHQSLMALCAWEREGLSTSVSVNLPVGSTNDDRYLRLVAAALAEFDLDAGRLTLELLEAGFVDRDLRMRRRSLDAFKALGVRLAQDDLGSGHSSLLRLRHFDFDDVKIDKSLVRGTELAPGVALHFIEPINDIAHSLGMSVVIEGLEDEGLVEAAVHLGVDRGQGHGIARPMPAADVVGWARGYRLDLDPSLPRTPMGALAAHVAWERRARGLGRWHGDEADLDLAACPLTAYIRRSGSEPMTDEHRAVHTAVVSRAGGVDRLTTWRRLASLLAPASPEVADL